MRSMTHNNAVRSFPEPRTTEKSTRMPPQVPANAVRHVASSGTRLLRVTRLLRKLHDNRGSGGGSRRDEEVLGGETPASG